MYCLAVADAAITVPAMRRDYHTLGLTCEHCWAPLALLSHAAQGHRCFGTTERSRHAGCLCVRGDTRPRHADPCHGLLQGINSRRSDMAGIRGFLAFLIIAAASSASATRLPDFSFGSEVQPSSNQLQPDPSAGACVRSCNDARRVGQPLSPCPEPPQKGHGAGQVSGRSARGWHGRWATSLDGSMDQRALMSCQCSMTFSPSGRALTSCCLRSGGEWTTGAAQAHVHARRDREGEAPSCVVSATSLIAVHTDRLRRASVALRASLSARDHVLQKVHRPSDV